MIDYSLDYIDYVHGLGMLNSVYQIHDKTCGRCASDNVVLDCISYKCMNCGNRWFESGFKPTIYELAWANRDVRQYNDKNKFKTHIRRRDVLGLFSPSECFFKNLEYQLLAYTPLTDYRYELGNLLLEGAGFIELKKHKMPEGCEKSDFNSFIRDYLSSRDELPFAPVVDDWSKYLYVSSNDLAEIFISGPHVDVARYLKHDTAIDVFQILFSERVRKERARYLDSDESLEHIDPDWCFHDYIDSNKEIVSCIDKYFSSEINVIKRFDQATKDKAEEFFERAINEHMSILDTMMLFVDYAFEGYNGY